MKISFHYNLKSHPDRLLKDHLLGVHQKAMALFDDLEFDFPNFNRDDLREVTNVSSLFHDFGKATSFFQDYIINPNRPSTEDSRKKRRHGLISAIAVYQILKTNYGNESFLPVLGFIIIRKHHGNLENYRNSLTISDNDLQNCCLQSENIDYQEINHILSNQKLNIDKSVIGDFQYREFRQNRRKDTAFTTEYYFVLNLLYSILLQADKTDAIMGDENIAASEMLKSESVCKFKNGFENNTENSIDKIREDAFNSVEETINRLNESDRILSINIPTGSGKTINSLNAALKLCEKFRQNHVVYCLPFTSVIDQNFKVFDEIRKSANLPNESGVLLKHHHLSDIKYNSVEDENVVKEYLPNKALHLIEGWKSRITVTTFVQFLYSLISYKNSSLRKFNRFSNAVIILDEIQSIPHEYWKLVKTMLSQMAELLNSRMVLVTATMPLIFSEKDDEIKELVVAKKEMFKSLNRIELDVSNLKNENMEWERFCDSATDLVKENLTKDILFVMNTIRSAKELFDSFSEIDSHKLTFLSSHIIPKERLKRIEEIKNRKGDEPILVVSTQLVEAGVDIDLDIVVRDFAPLDSIFQTCGRCNRESRDGVKGRVIMYSLKDSNSWTPSGVYKNFLKQKTKKVLNGKSIIRESDFFELAIDYFQEIQLGGSQLKSQNMLEKIEHLKYKDGDNKIEIKLIDDNFSSSIFVEYDENAKCIWDKYQNVLEWKNSFEKNAAINDIRQKLSEYIINVPKKCLPNEHDTGIYHLRHNRVQDYYDKATGFKIDIELPLEISSIIF